MHLQGSGVSRPQGLAVCSETRAGLQGQGRPPPAGLPSYTTQAKDPLCWAILTLVMMAQENALSSTPTRARPPPHTTCFQKHWAAGLPQETQLTSLNPTLLLCK